MRIRITGNGKDGIFPLDYRIMVTSMIKKAIENSDKEYYKELYLFDNKKNKKIKPFCFGVYFNDYKINGNLVKVNGNISIIVSTPDYNIGIALYNGLLNMNEYNFKNEYTFMKRRVMLEKENNISSEKVKFKTLSPIHIRDKENNAIDVTDSRFDKELNYITNVLLDSYRGYGLKEKLIFTPINMKKMVIKEKISGFVDNSSKEYIYINAYAGRFTLEGDIEDLKLLMQLGIGFRRSEGFGLIDLM
ncbi:MAG: CRISPR-associated endoribonuclease Cas6 [Clostridium sp.]